MHRKHHKHAKKSAAETTSSKGYFPIVAYAPDDENETEEPAIRPSLPDSSQPMKKDIVSSPHTETSVIGPTMPAPSSSEPAHKQEIGSENDCKMDALKSMQDEYTADTSGHHPESKLEPDSGEKMPETRSSADAEDDDEFVEKMLEEPVFVKYEFVNRKFEPAEGEEPTGLDGGDDEELEMNHSGGILQGGKRKAVDMEGSDGMPLKKSKTR